MKKKNKFIFAIIIAILIFASYFGLFINVDAGIVKKSQATQFNFNSIDVLKWAANCGADITSFDDVDNELWPFIGTEINSEMLDTKEAVALNGSEFFYDNQLNAIDAASLYVAKSGEDSFLIIKQLASAYSINENDIELHCIINMPPQGTDNDELNTITYVIKNGKLQQTAEEIEANNQKIVEFNKKVYLSGIHKNEYEQSERYSGTEQDWNDYNGVGLEDEEDVLNSMMNICDFTNTSVTAILPDGTEYKLVVGKNDEYINNWYLLRTKEAEKTPEPEVDPEPEPEKKFETELDYTAIVDGKNVGGQEKEGTFYPGYDKEKVEKDADVTATITSTTGNDIVQVNDKDLKSDGKPNEDGWYYVDVNNKKVIAKDYPFDDFDNLEDNGIVVEKGVKLTSSDGLDDTQDVSIKWPFRIIKVTQDPEKIEEDTEKVRVEITTNLPIEEEKLPDGWKFTADDEGKTQHRVYREFKKGENYDKDVILTANNRTDTDKTHVKIEWPKKENLPEEIPQTGSKNVAIISGVLALITIAGVSYKKFRK